MRSSRWWRIESEREMQPLGYNPTLNEIRDFEDESTKSPEKEHEGGQEDQITRGTKMSVIMIRKMFVERSAPRLW